ncbi:MAG: Uma2 family endonuclease [Bacteroidota bacterium]
MTAALEKDVQATDMIQLIEQLGGTLQVKGLDKSAFITFCGTYPELLMERDENGKITIISPVFGGSGFRESLLIRRVGNWCESYGQGQVGSSQIGYDLPDGSTRSPDVSWISQERLSNLTPKEIEKRFLPIVPDFIVELRSASDSLKKLKKKIQEKWIGNGVRLAWLIDPYKERAYIYREDESVEVEVVKNFKGTLSGEDVLPNFELKLSEFTLIGK